MGTGNLDRVKHVLAQALDLASDARPEFLDLACAGDVTLRAEIDSLLGQRSIDFSLLDGPIRSLFRPASGGLQGGTVAEPRPGDRVGPYRIERRLGEGGMGVVLLASREEDFRKRVAIKLVRSARMSRVVVLRFFRERQILAKLEHPNIARVLDGGLTRAGLPYFVMEYVDGLPIDEYCRRRALPIAGQVQLLIEICSALQAAHSHLVVHRDLKPSNILVTSEGVPKLLDFGIAKLLAPEADALLTDQHQRPMTLRYASPEQVCGTTLGTQSDIYSLAVVAFELLTGQMPYRLPSGGDLELARAICEQEPRRPSWALSEDRSRCRLRHPRFRRPQAADLDSIVLKALRKDPEHRYGSVEGMADDLKRFLEGRPVSARSGSRSYRAARFLSRHRWVTLSFLVFLLFAGTFAVASALLWQRAVVERARTHRVMSFMKEAIRSAGLDRAHGEVSTIEDLMRDAWRRIDELGDDPQTLTEFLETFGGLYVDLGLYPEAEEQLELVAALRREKHPDGDAALARAIGDRCGLLVRREDFRGAEACYREALDLWQALGSDPEAVAQARRDLASSLLIQGRSSEAASLLRQVVETR
ncbi:MAG: serine/threonine protein kinase, partial [Acidobacteria bacterium]|nr:serine/threonine protein kinase [Acidobacteriota bacterium]